MQFRLSARAVILAGLVSAVVGLAIAGTQARASSTQIAVLRPEGFARAVAQTSDGYLWVGTKKGLYRFDGTTFLLQHVVDGTPDLGLTRVRALAVAPDGALWIGLQDGRLFRRQQGRIDPVELPGPASANFLAMRFDRLGGLWIRTTQMAARLFEGQWVAHPLPTEGSDSEEIGLWPTAQGAAWVETRAGWKLLAKTSTEVPPAAPTPDPDFRAERFAQIVRLSLSASTSLPEGDSLKRLIGAWIHQVVKDRRGRVWFFTRSGVAIFSEQHLQWITVRDGLPDNNIRSGFEDNEGNLWLLTFGGVLVRVVSSAVYGLAAADGLGGNTPWAVAEDSAGTLWISTTSGLSSYRNGIFTNRSNMKEIPFHPRSLAAGPDGTVWITTAKRELYSWKDERATRLSVSLGAGEDLSALVATPDGSLIAGSTTGSLYRLEGESMVAQNTGIHRCSELIGPGQPCDMAIAAIVTRRAGGYWLGTRGGAIYQWEPGQAARLHPGGAALGFRVFEIIEDVAEPNTLWIGGSAGLVRLQGTQARRFGLADGLPDENFSAIVDDEKGSFWIGSEAGILRVSKQSLIARARDGKTRLDVAQYRPADGIPSDETLGHRCRPVVRMRNGVIVFTMLSGLAVIDPSLFFPAPALSVFIEELSFDGAPRRLRTSAGSDQPLQLLPGRGGVAVRFTAPALASPQNTRFRCWLDGFEKGFSACDGERSARYVNLPPGSYTMHVEALTTDGSRAPGRAEIAFRLLPHIWQTLWFWVLLGAAALSIVGGLAWQRSIRAQLRFSLILDERRRIARDLHDTLAQVFSAMTLQLDALGRSATELRSESRTRLAEIRHAVAEGRRSARAALWNLRNDAASVRSLEEALLELASPYEEVEIRVASEGAPFPLALSVANELLMIAQQAISNAIEHGGARHIGIQLQYSENSFSLWVHDDGTGFNSDTQAVGAGLGLSGMRERARMAGGQLTIESTEGVGTEIGVTIAHPQRRAVGRKST